MPFCSKCGNELKSGAKFCSKCGAQNGVPDPGICPVCQKRVTGNEKFCFHCGASIVQAYGGINAHNTPPPQPQPTYISAPHVQAPPIPVTKKKKGGCLKKIVLTLLLLIIAGATALYFLGDDPFDMERKQAELTGTDIEGIVPVDDTIQQEIVSETAIDAGDPVQAAIKVEDAFARADTSLLKQLLTPASLEVYHETFSEIQPYMSAYSKAFSKRKLKYSTPIYSLYEFTDETGKTFTAEFALCDDGQWKLVRF